MYSNPLLLTLAKLSRTGVFPACTFVLILAGRMCVSSIGFALVCVTVSLFTPALHSVTHTSKYLGVGCSFLHLLFVCCGVVLVVSCVVLFVLCVSVGVRVHPNPTETSQG